MSATRKAVLDVARSELGYREGPNNDTKYGRWFGLNHQPWCAMFVSWVADKAGASDIIPKFAYTPAGAAWFQKRGAYGKAPKAGAIGFVYEPSVGRIGHTFFVEAVHEDGSFTTLEGNTNNDGSRIGNGNYRLHRKPSSRYTFGYPDYKPVRPKVDPLRLRLAATTKGERDSYPRATRLVQRSLRKAGVLGPHYKRGNFGGVTRRAVKRYQRENGERVTGVLTRKQLHRLATAYRLFRL